MSTRLRNIVRKRRLLVVQATEQRGELAVQAAAVRQSLAFADLAWRGYHRLKSRPVGVAIVAGCGLDLITNILLTILGYFPGHIHAYYIEYVYYKRREDARQGIIPTTPAAGVYSDRVQRGGRNYGTIQPAALPPPQGSV